MRSAFYGFNVASRGLFAAKTNLDILNHNISNANTDGYSRQYAVQKAGRPLPSAGIGMVGSGAEVTSIARYHDDYLDTKYWSVNMDLGEATIKNQQMSQIEALFGEPTDYGFNTILNDYFDSLSELSKSPTEESTRTSVVNKADGICTYFKDMSELFRRYQREANFAIKSKVDEINYIAKQLQIINKQINNTELTGFPANDLRDERGRLLDQLSKIVNIEATETADVNGKKTMNVSINGQTLVSGSGANFLECVPRDNVQNPEDEPFMYDVYWTSGQKFYLNNANLKGELKGYVDIRDGNNNENFTGSVTAGAGTNVLTIDNPSRTDLPAGGEILIDGASYEYSSFTYNSATNQMTFNLTAASPATATDVRMGNGIEFKGIPYYMQRLNEFVRTFAKEVNKIHEQGNSGTGLSFFTYEGYTGVPALDTTDPTSYNQLTVDNMTVNKQIKSDIGLIMTKFNQTDGESANDLLLKMSDLRHKQDMFSQGEPENYLQAVLGVVGIDKKYASSLETSQKNLSNLIDNQRISISGANINEETVNLVKYQQIYNASAKIISVFDEIYDVTINRMGAS